MAKPEVIIYSDGGAKPNPDGPGGWAALLIFADGAKEISGREASTTNNRMELTAAIMALESLSESHSIEFHTDSQYLKNGITQWLANWIRNGWKTASRQPVLNQDLWQRLDAVAQEHSIRWQWVKGHSTSQYNNRVDELATAAREGRAAADVAAAKAESDIRIYLYTQPNRWGAVTVTPDAVQQHHQHSAGLTSNQLALAGCAHVLGQFSTPQTLTVYSDSEYLINGMGRWIKGWMNKGWKTASGDPVKNQEFWKPLIEAAKPHRIRWEYREKLEDPHARKAWELAGG